MSKAPENVSNTAKGPEPLHERGVVGTHWGFYTPGTTPDRLEPLKDDPDPASFGMELIADRLAPSRILKPAVRLSFLEHGGVTQHGRRGAEPFVEVSWDEALDLVASEIARVKYDYGSGAIFSGSYGWSSAGRFHHAQSQLKRFFNVAGGSVRSVQTYSYAAGEIILPHVIGTTKGLITGHTPWSQIIGHSELIVMFGGTPLRNAQVNAGGVARHLAREALLACKACGTRLINVSPVSDDVEESLAAEWLPLRPCTDTALILALCHTLISESLHDVAFINLYTSGFETFRAYVMGEKDGIAKDALWASHITGIPPQAIVDLAREMATKKTFIMMAWALQRADHGEQPYWAAITLASLLGGIGLPGQGFGFGYASVASRGQVGSKVQWPSLPQGRNPVSDYIPVARIADMLLSPGSEYEHNGDRRTYPDIKLVYWAGGNPFHHHQDINRLVEAWQKPQTIIAHEHFWNAHARHADIVLPAATFFERDDLVASGRDNFIAFSTAIASAPDNIPTDHEILRRLASRLDVEKAFTEDLSEAQWLERLYEDACKTAASLQVKLPEFFDFKKDSIVEAAVEKDEPFLASFREDPENMPLRTPSGRIELASKVIEQFGYDDCPGHPAWLAPKEWLGSPLATTYPLHLLSCQPHDKLHSQWDHAAPSRRTKAGGRQPVRIHPADAKARGIEDGDVVEVTNARGTCLAVAAISDAVMPGVVQLATGAWFNPADPEKQGSLELNGNPNVLTPDHGTSRLAQGPSPNACLVEVRRYRGTVPVVTIYNPMRFATDPRQSSQVKMNEVE